MYNVCVCVRTITRGSMGLKNFSVNAGPMDPKWSQRLEEEILALVSLVEENSENGNDWFNIEPVDDSGIKWTGTCSHVYDMQRYTFKVKFEIPAMYPMAPIEVELPELDGLTSKMYRGGKICLDLHFAPLWRSNAPKFGIVHALTFALGPWLAAEIPYLMGTGVIVSNV